MKALSSSECLRRCDPASLPFDTTETLPVLDDHFGQERAVEALHFGIGMRHPGYHLFVLGPPRLGKQSFVRRFLEARTRGRPAPRDQCYVCNFFDPHRPRALMLPAGRGVQLQRDMAGLITALKAGAPIRPLLDALKARYADLAAVARYLEEASADLEANVDYRAKEASNTSLLENPLHRYRVNVIVDHGQSEGPPIVFVDNPSLPEIVGRIEHAIRQGELVTDFALIRPGALHRANDGFLLLDAAKVIAQPTAWEALKRSLLRGEIRIDAQARHESGAHLASLEPDPLPMAVKVILFGERALYCTLHESDPDFRAQFQVQVEFEDQFPRSREAIAFYARFVATICRRDALLPFDRTAVARIIDHGARQAGDRERLSAHMRDVGELAREADYWARRAGAPLADRAHVQHAIDARVRRADHPRDQGFDDILRKLVLIETRGEHIGQVNGLSVFRYGDFEFAEPTRITATARPGEGDVLDIQREVELGGLIHSKGVLILSSFLAARYAKTAPLSLAASLVCEQTFEPVEGDSASAAELCALLSALADVPIRQSLAITGAVDQHGRIQAVGAVNEKVEGFFDICVRQELTGDQGVIIPAANATHLMLREEVVAAVASDRFSVYAVETVDEAIELLTGCPAGAPDARGLMGEGGINARVHARLYEYSLIRREYDRRGRHRFSRQD